MQQDNEVGKELAKTMINMVNKMDSSDNEQAFVEEIINSHRTLQQSTGKLLLKVFAAWAEVHDSGYYDLRNEATVQLGKTITEATKDTPIPYI